MDCKIWEKTILSWVNSMKSGIPISKINQLNDGVLVDILKKFQSKYHKPIDFLKANYPNLGVPDYFTLSSSYDYLSAATCFLIHASFSNKQELNDIREEMCSALDNITQQNIAEFLTVLGHHKDVFQLSFKTITKEIFDFIEKHDSHSSLIGDGLSTPVKSCNLSAGSYNSPLQDFFQTPKKSRDRSSHKKVVPVMCGDGDHAKHIKQLKDHLAEEEMEKASLQEKLIDSVQKCNEFEIKLKDKIEEIRQLKYEWESESRKNEDEIANVRDKLQKKFDEERKLKSELSHLESFVSSLESDLSESLSEKVRLENQLKLALDKFSICEDQLKETTAMNSKLQELLNAREKELEQMRDNFDYCYKGGKCIEISFGDGSLDSSACVPETMDVVVDKLLKEKIEENSMLKETIEELKISRHELFSRIGKLEVELSAKNSTISELQYLNKELENKIERFNITEANLLSVQKELAVANSEINKLLKENTHLTDKCNALNSRAEENEKALSDMKSSKMFLQFDFLKLAHDFNSVQQRLETEVNYITKLVSDGDEKYSGSGDIKKILSDQTFDLIKTSMNKEDMFGTSPQSPFEKAEEKMEKLRELLNYFESYDRGWSESKTSMQRACVHLNDSIVSLKLKIGDLETNRKSSIEEKIKLEKCLEIAEKKISEIQELHSSEIKRLKTQLEEKELLIADLEDRVLKLKENSNIVPEKEILMNETCKNDVTFIYEGGDFAKKMSSQSDHKKKDFAAAVTKSYVPLQKEQLNDSLEEVPVSNKTFEIVNLDENDIIDKTFSIKKDKSVEMAPRPKKNGSSWSVSPPKKTLSKTVLKSDKKHPRGESWVVPLSMPLKKDKTHKANAYFSNELAADKSSSNLTKSSSLSSIVEVTSSPLSKFESKTSGATSFFSVTDLMGSLNKKYDDGINDLRKAYSSELYLKDTKSETSLNQVFRLVDRQEDPLGDIFRGVVEEYDKSKKREWEKKFSQMRKEIIELSNECERLRSALSESEQKRKKEKEFNEKNNESIAQSITSKYEMQLEHLKTEMKQLYNRELAKHKSEQSKLNMELREQNNRQKEHIDNLRSQLWEVREKLLEEQNIKKDLEKICSDLRRRYENMLTTREADLKSVQNGDVLHQKEQYSHDKARLQNRHIPNGGFPTIPTEDEDEVFDNRFLEDMKQGKFPSENPEDRLKELQNRNTLVLPHLKSSYPAETQFHNPSMFKETDLKFGHLNFGQESQSLTDSDHSMTKSLLPENKGKKKEQTSYKKPGPPTPSKYGGRLSLQSGDFRTTPRNALKELHENEKNKVTPNRLSLFLPVKSVKRESLGGGSLGGMGLGRDENAAPVTPRKKFFGKSGKILRKPFGARDH